MCWLELPIFVSVCVSSVVIPYNLYSLCTLVRYYSVANYLLWGLLMMTIFFLSYRLDAIEKSLSALDLSDDQKENMTSFLKEKRMIINFGDLKEQDFERITELGSGNGGVVLKVKHTPSGITMARKVS